MNNADLDTSRICFLNLPSQLLIDILACYMTICDLARIRLTCKSLSLSVESASIELLSREGIFIEEVSRKFRHLQAYFTPRIYLIGGMLDCRRADIFYPETAYFRLAGSLGLKRNQEFDAVYHQGHMYAISGCSELAISKVERYNFISNMWSEIPALPKPIVACAAVSYHTKLLCIGGHDHTDFKNVSTVYEYKMSPTSQSWEICSSIPPLPCPRAYHAAIVYRDRIWVAGGSVGMPANTVEAYNPVTGLWETQAPMIRNHRELRLVIVHDELYAVGGDYEGILSLIGSIERYDVTSKAWVLVSYFPHKRRRSTACSYGRYIYIFGDCGHLDSAKQSSWDAFDTVRGEWLSKLHTHEHQDSGNEAIDDLISHPELMDRVPSRRDGSNIGFALTVCPHTYI